MGDENGEGAAERDTKEHWEKEKAKLEASKLGIEFRNYERRLELEDKKLESDVKDWYFRAFVAIITTIASVAGFFFGKIYESSSDANKQRFELTLQRDREENEDFSKNLASLSSSDLGQRAVAAAALHLYVQRISVRGYDPGADNVIRDRDEQRIDEVLRTVSARLPSETDSLLLEEYSGLLVAVPSRALPYSVSLDRRAGSQLARSAADYVAWSLSNSSRFQDLGCENDAENPYNAANQQEVNKIIDGDLKELGARTQMPFEGDVDERGPVNPTVHVKPLISSRWLGPKFQRECRLVVTLRSQENGRLKGDERSKSYDELKRAVRVMSVASLTLNRILHRLNGHVAGQDLSGTFMVNGSLDKLNLSNAILNRSYVDGIAQNFTCQRCDFSSADLSQFHLSAPCNVAQADFKGVDPESMQGLNLSSCDK